MTLPRWVESLLRVRQLLRLADGAALVGMATCGPSLSVFTWATVTMHKTAHPARLFSLEICAL